MSETRRDALTLLGTITATCCFPFASEELYGQHVHLAPFAKPALLKACCETAGADGRFALAEVELVRMIAATLDCPLPPVISAHDPLAAAA